MLAFFGASAAGGVIVAGAVTALQVYNPRSSRNLTMAALQTHGAQIEALQKGFTDVPTRGEVADSVAALTETNYAAIQEQLDIIIQGVPSRDEVADAFKKVGAIQRQQQVQPEKVTAEAEHQMSVLRARLAAAEESNNRLAAERKELASALFSERQQMAQELEQFDAAMRQAVEQRDYFSGLLEAAAADQAPGEQASLYAEEEQQAEQELQRPATEEQAVAMNPLNARKDPALAFASQGNVKARIAALRAQRAAG